MNEKTSKNPIKLGYIGSGIAARDIHLPVLSDMKDKFNVCAVSSRSQKHMDEFSLLAGGVLQYGCLDQMLENKEIEAVVVCTPFTMNLEMVRRTLEAGKHVLVEKPIAANLEDAQLMIKIARKTSLVTMVAENWRYKPILLKARQYLESGVIGNPFQTSLHVFSQLDITSKYFSQSTWRLNSNIDSVMLIDCGVHFIAGLRMLFGDITEGFSVISRTFPHNDALIDSIIFSFRCAGGVQGVLEYHLNSFGFSHTNLIILGEHGSILIDNNWQRLNLWQGNNYSVDCINKDSDGIYGEFDDYYHAIREGRSCRSTFDESYKDLETIDYAINNVKF